MRVLPYFLLMFVLACPDNNPILLGSNYEISDAALVECEPYLKADPADPTGGKHTCLITTNPYKGILRVFDVTDNQFVLAPIGYLPLAVLLRSSPEKVASIDGSPWVAVLDSLDSLVRIVPSTNTPLAFSSPTQSFVIKKPGASQLLLAKVQGKVQAFVVLPEAQIQVAVLDPKTGAMLADPTVTVLHKLTKSGEIIDISIDPGGDYLWVAGETQAVVLDLKLNSWSETVLPPDPKKPGAISKIVSGRKDLGSGPVPMALALSQDASRAFLYGADAAFLGGVDLTGKPAAAYIPAGKSDTCCNGENTWAAVLTTLGDVQYLLLDKIVADAKEESEKTFGKVLHLATQTGVLPKNVANTYKLLGGEVVTSPLSSSSVGGVNLICPRRMFFAFSGYLGSFCEGSSDNVNRIDLR